MSVLYGYIRVSSEHQKKNFSLENQKEKLTNLGVLPENIFEDIGSGMDYNREGFSNLLKKAKKGDVIYVDKIDRFGRSMHQGLKLFLELQKRGVTLLSLDLPFVEDRALHDLIVSLMLFVAEKDQKMRKQRQLEGIEKARLAGKYKGRKSVITSKILDQYDDLASNTKLTKTQIAKVLGISRSTIYNVIKKKKNSFKGE